MDSSNTSPSQLDATNSDTQPERPPVPHLLIEAAESFNYAAWQNAVPLLHSLVINNTDGPELSSLSVELKATPRFTREKRWTIDRVSPGEKLKLKDLDLEIDPAYLEGLDEAERGVLTLELLHNGKSLFKTNHVLRVLARDEWGGMSTMGELLPAFVTPNDPALAALLRTAATMLEQHGHPTSLEGYQSGDPKRTYMLAASLWSAVAGRSLIYANPPGSFEQVGQKTRRVGTVLSDGLATCLDTTLLFASGLEAIGLNPVLVMTQGHCFVGVWLINKTFKRLVERECSELRKAIAAKELIVFETTLVTHRPAARFPDAVSIATSSIAEEKEHEFVAVVDVARARMSQILPLASHTAKKVESTEGSDSVALPLPAAPNFTTIISAENFEERPTTPAGRIDRWQRKLLDLSLRNRLLNFRPSKQSVPVMCPDISQLEDRLANGTSMRLVSLADGNPIGKRDADLHLKRTQKDLDWEFARQALDRDEVVCPVELRDLESRLIALYRKARNDLVESGTNTLYLAVGFLRWKQNPRDEKTYRAPLLLVPVKLTRRSAASPFYLGNHEDEVRFNATLVQLLKKDFDCDLTAFESQLPMDDSGVDVPLVFERMRQAIRDIPGFEVIEEAAIAPFSFAKYLMWKDLVDRIGQLENNRVVRHLIHDPDKPFVPNAIGPMPQSFEIDSRYSPEQIVHPLPADSSQLAAVMAASEGHDLVIVGPPGTGKSQTIANLIAQCLAVGKTVLFVAEKTAALDVVHRRLREHGLGDCCVELHSNKAEKRRFLDQLESSWKNRGHEPVSEWVQISEQLRIRRDQLNAYAAAMHTPEANGWTAYRAMGVIVKGRDLVTPPLNWPDSAQHNREKFAELLATVSEIAMAFQALPTHLEIPRIEVTEWSMKWETNLLEACRQLEATSKSLATSLQEFSAVLGVPALVDVNASQMSLLYRFAVELTRSELPPADILLHVNLSQFKAALDDRAELLRRSNLAKASLTAAVLGLFNALTGATPNSIDEEKKRSLYRLANELVRTPVPMADLVFHHSFADVIKGLADRPELLRNRDKAFEALVARSYNPALIDRMQADTLEREWSKASKSLWPLSWWSKGNVNKRFKAYMTAEGQPDPEIDLPLLREYEAACKLVAENLAALDLPPQLQALIEKEASALDSQIPLAQRLREAFQAAGFSPVAVGKAAQARLEPLIATAKRLYPAGKEVEAIRLKLKENFASLGLSPTHQNTVLNDPQAFAAPIQTATSIRDAATAVGVFGDNVLQVLKTYSTTPDPLRRKAATEYCRAAKDFQQAWVAYNRLAATTPVAKESSTVIADAAAQAQSVLSRRTALKHWTSWLAVQNRAKQLGLWSIVEALQSGTMKAPDAVACFQLAYARWWLPNLIDRREPLRTFQRFLHENAIEDFRRLDDKARQAASPRVREAVLHGLPAMEQVPRKSELGLLRHQIGLKRPNKSIREMISGMPESFGKLASCLLMSPLSIAQYLPADQSQFDVVVFDEASQIATWDAIGAIARGKQTIIVGDPKQLPPTNFFGKADSDEDDVELADHEKDLESILDEAQASGIPTLQLNWHYRSRHESLIAFSNWNYYGNRLVTFPAAESADRGVSLRHIQGALYDRGKSRTNRQEAEAIAADLVERMKRCLGKPENQRLTYGVVTFNSQQQELLQDLLDAALRQSPELEWFFAEERIEPTMVKNLENVQGDERDVMMFSITFGFDAAGKFPIDFGAINRIGGERRLNVAITRARQELVVYASFLPDQLRAERSNARGVHDLKAFLEYADKGPEAIIARNEGSLGGYESPLEEAVAIALVQRGWRVETQIGVSGFRIDLGIVHPDTPGAYLAGVECDGATYHRSAVARDRDKIRQQVLENLGWNIVRVWSTDWWYDPDTALEQIDNALKQVLQRTRELAAPQDILNQQHDVEIAPKQQISANDEAPVPSPHQLIAKQIPQRSVSVYARTNLDDASANQSRFFDADYSEALRNMALSILQSHGPIRDDVLAREIAKAHGFARTSSRIKQRVLELLSNVTRTEENVGYFLWQGNAPQVIIPFRYPLNEETRRSLDEIAMPELIGLVKEHPDLITSNDPAIALAREIGLARLASSARERLEAAIEASCGEG